MANKVHAIEKGGGEEVNQELQKEPQHYFLKKIYLLTGPAQELAEVKDLDRHNIAIPLIAAFQIVFFALMVYITYTSAITQRQSKYLSLISDAQGATCTAVPIAVNAQFIADKNGHWNTHSNFDTSLGIYQISFLGTQADSTTFANVMKVFGAELKRIGELSAKRDYAWSLIAWSSFRVHDVNTNLDFFTISNAKIAFDQPIKAIGIASNSGHCRSNVSWSSGYDVSTGIISLIMDSGGKDPAQYCNQFSNKDFKYIDPTTKEIPEKVEISIDIGSVSTAIACNFGILKPERDLILVYSEYKQYDDYYFEEVLKEYGNFYIDSFYPFMEPIFCLNPEKTGSNETNNKAVCFVYFRAAIFYPVVSSYTFLNATATCQDECMLSKEHRSKWCQIFDILFGLVFFPMEQNNHDTRKIFEFGLSFLNGTDFDIVDRFAKPLVAITDLAQFFNPIPRIEDDAIVGSHVSSICSNCSILLVEFWSEDSTDTPFINQNDLSLHILSKNEKPFVKESIFNASEFYLSNRTIMSCDDTIYQKKAIEAITYDSPVALVEKYFECQLTWSTAITNAIGIAAGTATLYSSIFIAAAIALSVFFLNKKIKNDEEKILSKEEKRIHVEKCLYREIDFLKKQIKEIRSQV